MIVRFKLFGTLSQHVPGFQHSKENEIEISDGARVKDLLSLLEIPESKGAIVISEGRLLADEDLLEEGVCLNVFQAIRGG